MVDWYMVSVLIFAAFLAALVYLDRKNWKRESVLLLRKTQTGKRFLIRLGTRFPRFWLVIGTIAVIITLLSSVWIFWLLIMQTQLLATGAISVGPGILVPSASNQTTIGPGYFSVPFWYWIISLAVLVIVHEGMHGVMAAREKVRIKSLGWGLLAVIPMAFVEADEKQLQKQKPWKQLRVFAAGSFANFVVAAASVGVLLLMAASLLAPAGIGYQALAPSYPAASVNLTGTIVRIDGQAALSRQDLSKILTSVGPNQTITIETANATQNLAFTLVTAPEPEPDFAPDFTFNFLAGVEQILPGTIDFSHSASATLSYMTGSYQPPTWSSLTKEIKMWEYVKAIYPHYAPRADLEIAKLGKQLESHPRSGFIGILGVFDSNEIKPGLEAYTEAITFLEGLMFFMFLINLGVGTFNMLPIGPLDGGRMWGIIFKKVSPRYAKRMLSILTWIILAIIVADFVLVVF